jgi:hypothetical protein
MCEGGEVESINIELLQILCRDIENIEVTQHTLLRFWERGIVLKDVVNAIQSGEIIEQYPSDYPYPSCLVLGLSVNKSCLHTVCGVGNNKLWIITAYFPTSDMWESNNKTRKADKI